jgi:hypothetical protein
MKPLKDYLIKNFEKSALEQLADDYRDKGYTIKTDVSVGPFRVDLIATKGDETIYIEMKTHSENPDAKRRIKAMADYFKTIPNAKFIVAISRYPEPKKIEFDDIGSILTEYFTLEFPSDLDALSTHTMIDDVHGVSINEVRIQDGEFYIICNGMVGVTLQYGSDSDQERGEEPMYMSFPFKFKGTFSYENRKYFVSECDELEIDTDAYYE